MQLEILTPEQNIFKGEAKHVELPGTKGAFGILDNHAPMVSGLDKGTVKINTDLKSGDKLNAAFSKDPADPKLLLLNIKGGFVEVLNNKVSILIEAV